MDRVNAVIKNSIFLAQQKGIGNTERAAGVSPGYLSRSKQGITLKTFFAFADALGVAPEDLLTDIAVDRQIESLKAKIAELEKEKILSKTP